MPTHKEPNEKVKQAIKEYCESPGKQLDYEKTLARVRWDYLMGCFFFWDQMTYVGIEEDGYLHT